MSSPAHDIRNVLTVLALSDDAEVRAAGARIASLLPALGADAAVVDGLRLRLRDLEARLAATEDALAGQGARLPSETEPCASCGGTGVAA